MCPVCTKVAETPPDDGTLSSLLTPPPGVNAGEWRRFVCGMALFMWEESPLWTGGYSAEELSKAWAATASG